MDATRIHKTRFAIPYQTTRISREALIHLHSKYLLPSSTNNLPYTIILMTIFRLKPTKLPDPPSTILLPILPFELRAEIYYLATFLGDPVPHYVTISATDTLRDTDPRFPPFLPRLARLNEGTRLDIGLWFISVTEFGVLYPQNVDFLSSFLETFPLEEGFAAVRRLDFLMFGRYHPAPGEKNTFVDLVLKCKGVSEVTLKFEVWNVLKRKSNHRRIATDELRESGEQIPELEAIIETYGLEDILGSKSLVALTIEFWPKLTVHTRTGVYTEMPDCWPVMERLTEWLRQGFRTRGMEVDVRLVPSANEGLRWGRRRET